MDAPYDSNRRPTLIRRWSSKSLAAFALVLAVVVVGPSGAGAEVTLSVSPANGLDPAGAFVVVSGGGYVPNSQLFVMQCRSTSTDDHVCNSVGLRKVTTDANGSFTANAMRLVGRFGATDCSVEACSIMTSAVSGHSDDRSQDKSAVITFAAPTPPPPPATQPPAAPPASTPPTAAPAVPPAEATTASTSTTTTVADGSTTSAEADSTTLGTGEVLSASADPAPGSDDGDGDGDNDAAGHEDAQESALSSGAGATEASGDDGGSSMPLLAGALVLLVAVGAGGAFALRRRNATTP